MTVLHFLNVGNGDCSIIQHPSGRVTMIDVCKARKDEENSALINEMAADFYATTVRKDALGRGNYNQKAYPTNPIVYMKERGIAAPFRFIASHPDMDHLDGIEDLYAEYPFANFWDVPNKKTMDFSTPTPFREQDWKFYKRLRDNAASLGVTRLALQAGANAQFYNMNEDGTQGGDGLYVLSPVQHLIDAADESGDYNDCSYVILLRTQHGRRIVFAGDSHDATWEHILLHYGKYLRDIDLLIAPHHGRDSGRCYDFLDVLNPAVTFFGIARAEHLGYSQWSRRGLQVFTNNQCRDIIVDGRQAALRFHCTNKKFADDFAGCEAPFNNVLRGYQFGFMADERQTGYGA